MISGFHNSQEEMNYFFETDILASIEKEKRYINISYSQNYIILCINSEDGVMESDKRPRDQFKLPNLVEVK